MELKYTSVLFAMVVLAISVPQSYSRPQSTAEMEEIKKALFNTCNAKFQVTDEMRAKVKSGTMPEDRDFKCFIMCFMEELSLIDEEGVIDGDSLIAMAMDPMKPALEEVVKNCKKDITGKPDKCEVAFNFITCGAKISPNILTMASF